MQVITTIPRDNLV